jgi:hypothetical protein
MSERAVSDASIPASTEWNLRRRVAGQIARQEVIDALYGWQLYGATSLGLILGSLFIFNALSFVDESGLLIFRRPFFVPLLVSVTIIIIGLTAWATLAIARQRDLGGLRVLFFAPVDAVGVIGGYVIAGAALMMIQVAALTPLLALIALIANLPLPGGLIIGLLAAPVYGALGVAIGLLLSAIAATSRSALFFLGGALLLILAVPAGYAALLNAPQESRFYDALLFLRTIVRMLRDIINWISPFALAGAALDAGLRGNWFELLRLISAGILGVVAWGVAAIWGLRRRGVLP